MFSRYGSALALVALLFASSALADGNQRRWLTGSYVNWSGPIVAALAAGYFQAAASETTLADPGFSVDQITVVNNTPNKLTVSVLGRAGRAFPGTNEAFDVPAWETKVIYNPGGIAGYFFNNLNAAGGTGAYVLAEK